MATVKNEVGNSFYEMLTELIKSSQLDYIDANGDLIKGVTASAVMVTAEADLANLTDYEPGSIAYVAGFGSMWQLGADGTWETVI